MTSIMRHLKICVKRCFPLLAAKHNFYSSVGRWPDLKAPKLLSEKVMRRLYNTDHSLYSRLADKYLVREYVSDRGYADILVPLYGHWSKPEEIDFSSLPGSVVFKTNNSSGAVILVDDLRTADKGDIKHRLLTYLKDPYWCYSGEIHYKSIKPQIIAEQMLKDERQPDRPVVDYKFYCFGGRPEFCLVCLNRKIETHQRDNAFYDINWTRCDDRWAAPTVKLYDGDVPKPKNLDFMLRLCHDLTKDLPFVRLDLYEVGGKVYFGELTFTPNAFACGSLSYEAALRAGSMIPD